MPQNYYSTSDNYPSIILPILERIQYLVCEELLYPDEDYVNPHPKFILAEQTDDAFRLGAKAIRKINFAEPFTVYNIGDLEIDEERVNVNAKLGLYYSNGYSSTVDSTASILTIPMMSVYNTVHDYLRALTILNSASTDNKKILVPCTVNSVSTSFYVLVSFEPSKGPYALELQEQRRVGKINTIQHDFRVFFHNPILDTGVSPVDSIELTLEAYALTDYRDSITISSGIVPATPVVSSTSPVSGTVDVAVGSNITLNFNVAMEEDITVDNLYVSPLFLFETAWNATSTTVVVDPHDALTSGVTYTIKLYEEAVSGDRIPLAEDFSTTFTTIG